MECTNQAGKKCCKVWILKNSSTSNTFETNFKGWPEEVKMELAISFDLLLEIVYRLIGKGLGGVGWKMKVPWCECILALFFTRPSVFNPCNLAACCRMSIGYKQWGWIYFFSELLLFLKKAEALKLGSVRWHLKVSDLDIVEESSNFTC